MESIFSKEQFDHIYPDGIENHYWNFARNRILMNFIKSNKLLKAKILEIGCGRGIVVNDLRRWGLDVYGVELANTKAIDLGIKKYLYLNTDALHLSESFRKSIEIICLLDVLEHIEKPEDFLTQLKNSYPNVKGFILTLPARQELYSNYDEFNRHFLRYNRKKLKAVLDSSGLVSDRIGYLFHSLYIPALLTKALAKRNTTLKSPKGIMLSIHKLIARIFLLEYNIVPSRIFGTSLISYSTIK